MTDLDVTIGIKLEKFDLNIAFSTGKGCLGILGPSGFGKTMTLKSIAGIVNPDSGRIVLRDEDGEAHVLYDSGLRRSVPPQKRRVGYLFQNYALFPNMNVEQNIAVGLKSRGAAKEKQRREVERMIHMFHLEGCEKQYPLQLSGGQQQRVALARVLAYEPDVLLLDEPFSAMDTFLREGLRLELLKVLREFDGIAVLVTHDRDEAYQLCDHLLLLDEGKVIGAGETKAVFENPGTVKAARLTGCKNISRIQKLGEYRVKALDWDGMEFVTEQRVEDGITHIGIRAHDFLPYHRDSAAQGGDASGWAEANCFAARALSISEMPFEWYVTLDNGIWWKTEKQIHSHETANLISEYFTVDPGSILLLRD